MTSKDYYNSTRMVETRQWTLDMALAFAEEYHTAKMEKDVNDHEEKILYWAKRLEHKSLSLHELVENVKWLITQLNKQS